MFVAAITAFAPEKLIEAQVKHTYTVNSDANGHYGDPSAGCMADEKAVQITGVAGDVCTPACAGTTCPTDVPSGVTATPVCALQDPTGNKYCILECTPGQKEDTQCGTASCKSVQGVGICTYDDTVHPERAKMIQEINSKPGVTWTAKAHPRFSTEAPGASKNLLGVKGNWGVDIREAHKAGEIKPYVPSPHVAKMIEADTLPASFDSAVAFPQCAKTINDIRDQSNCGCCWAFGGAEAASDRMCIASNATLLMPLSAQDVCFNSNFDGCGGGQITTPWSFIKSKGAVTGGNYGGTGAFGGGWCSSFSLPHCHHHGPVGNDPYPAEGAPGCPSENSPRGPKACDSDAKDPHTTYGSDKYTFTGDTHFGTNVKYIKGMLVEGGPVETAFTVYEDFENYAGGVYKHVSGAMAGGHAVKIVGWGTDPSAGDYWKVANSWNPYWGEKGFFRIAFGEGGIDDQVIASAKDAKWGKK